MRQGCRFEAEGPIRTASRASPRAPALSFASGLPGLPSKKSSVPGFSPVGLRHEAEGPVRERPLLRRVADGADGGHQFLRSKSDLPGKTRPVERPAQPAGPEAQRRGKEDVTLHAEAVVLHGAGAPRHGTGDKQGGPLDHPVGAERFQLSPFRFREIDELEPQGVPEGPPGVLPEKGPQLLLHLVRQGACRRSSGKRSFSLSFRWVMECP